MSERAPESGTRECENCVSAPCSRACVCHQNGLPCTCSCPGWESRRSAEEGATSPPPRPCPTCGRMGACADCCCAAPDHNHPWPHRRVQCSLCGHETSTPPAAATTTTVHVHVVVGPHDVGSQVDVTPATWTTRRTPKPDRFVIQAEGAKTPGDADV